MPTDATQPNTDPNTERDRSFRQLINARLREMDRRIDLLQDKHSQMPDDARGDYRDFMSDLQRRRQGVVDKLAALGTAKTPDRGSRRNQIETDIGAMEARIVAAAERFNVIRPQQDLALDERERESRAARDDS